jgi:hypothetical protein
MMMAQAMATLAQLCLVFFAAYRLRRILVSEESRLLLSPVAHGHPSLFLQDSKSSNSSFRRYAMPTSTEGEMAMVRTPPSYN